jgi:hypothetical protein
MGARAVNEMTAADKIAMFLLLHKLFSEVRFSLYCAKLSDLSFTQFRSQEVAWYEKRDRNQVIGPSFLSLINLI